ncbi:kinase-like domain-containing protein [Aspergillus carlsbadensis]|nr:kinase-like domain-containing protein [Aspergillus carlsbadensis]
MLAIRVRSSQLQVPLFRRRASQCLFMSTILQSGEEHLPVGTPLRGNSGQNYTVQEILASRQKPLPSVYRATSANGVNYVIKDMIEGEFDYQLDLQRPLSSCPNIRSVTDTIKEREMFVYPFLSTDLLRLSQRPLSMGTRRHILREALRGLVDLHALDILHNDIKPNNILIDYDKTADDRSRVNKVQVSDLEDAVIVPPGKWLRGPLCGNALWRSPESWCRSRQNQASDVFSFGVTSANSVYMIYAMVNEMVFHVPNSQMTANDSWRPILFRHISYFGDEDGVNGLLDHIGEENVFQQRLIGLVETLGTDNPRQPLETWNYLDPELRALIGRMTRLDPSQRITAEKALEHPWFVDGRS